MLIGVWSRGAPDGFSSAADERESRWSGEDGATEQPGAFGERVKRVDLSGFGGEAQCLGADADECRGLVEVSQGSTPSGAGRMNRNLVIGAQRRDAFARPSIAIACDELVAIEGRGDEIVASDERENAHRGDDVDWRAVALPLAPAGRRSSVWAPPAQ